jgi:hypothetical protein
VQLLVSLKLKLQLVDGHVRQVLGLSLEKQRVSSGILDLPLLLLNLLKVVIERSNQVLVDNSTNPINDGTNSSLVGVCQIRSILA